jgi:hypothetical protein
MYISNITSPLNAADMKHPTNMGFLATPQPIFVFLGTAIGSRAGDSSRPAQQNIWNFSDRNHDDAGKRHSVGESL